MWTIGKMFRCWRSEVAKRLRMAQGHLQAVFSWHVFSRPQSIDEACKGAKSTGQQTKFVSAGRSLINCCGLTAVDRQRAALPKLASWDVTLLGLAS